MRVATPVPWATKAVGKVKPQGNFTGVSFGHYFLNGKLVSREEYLAARPSRSGKPGKGERAQAKAGLPPPLKGKPATTDPRHNPDLDAAMAAPAHRAHTPALNELVDPRHNPDLDDAMGMGPASGPAAGKPRDTSHIGRDLFAERAGLGEGPKPRAEMEAAAEPPPLPGQDAAAATLAAPPPLPHHRTHTTALGAANKLVAAARDGKSRRHVKQAHADAVIALHDHEREGHRAIDRMAKQKYGDSAKGRFLAAKAKREFGQKMTAARQRLAKLAGPHAIRTGKLEKGLCRPFDPYELDPETAFQLADARLT